MKYTRQIGYGVLFGAALMTCANIDVKAEENEQPMEIETIPNADEIQEMVPDQEKPVTEEIEEVESISEVSLSAEQTEVNNGIPVIYLNIDESKGTIDAMNSDPDHNTYCYGTMDLILPSSDFQYADLNSDLKEYRGLEMSIKGRGHSTWIDEKKPYKIKLDQKQDLLGLGKDEENKHWVLLANSVDPTLMKQRLTADLGEAIGLEYTPIGVPVDVVMNDQYLGNYLLMEHVRVDTGRIDIDKLDEDDVSEPEITGGYVVQNGIQTNRSDPGYFETKSGARWNNHTPSFNPEDGDYENDIQKNYIRDYIQMVEDILMSDSQKDDQGNSYTAYMDPVSAAKYWWVQTVSVNNDAYESGSTYLYKKRNDILYWGPLWDFDQGWGYPYFDDEESYEGFNLTSFSWIPAMLYDKSEGSIYQNIINEWPGLRDTLRDYIKDGGMIDRYYDEIKASEVENEKLYPIKDDKPYEDWVNDLKLWIQNRVDWIDEHLSDLEEISRKVVVKVDGLSDKVYYKQNGSRLFFLKDPVKEGFVFTGWYDQNGEKVTNDDVVGYDMILTAAFVSEEEATKYEEIIFRRDVETLSLSDNPFGYRSIYTGFPEEPQLDTIIWSSSDESIASVNKTGLVNLRQTGTVTITATVPNGQSFSYVLNIIDDPVMVTSFTITETMDLQPGEHRRIDLVCDPVDATISNLCYTTEDEIISVDYFTGVVTGLKEGTAIVKVTITLYGEQDQILEKTCIVNVKKEIPSSITPQTEPSSYTPPSPVHGVPTGIILNIGSWIGAMVMAALGMVLSFYRRIIKK